MAKESSRSHKTAAKVLYAAFQILKANGNSMRGFDVIDKIRQTVQFDEWELHRYGKTGYIRWESMLHFFSIDCVKAGFLQKNKGVWILTREGENVIQLGASGLLQEARKAYFVWKSKQKADEQDTDIETAEVIGTEEETFEQKQKALLEQFEDQAYKGLRGHIQAKNPYEFQDLVAGLLSSMGYFISMVSPKGRDGGIDIIAYTDPLGTKQPRIIVQVKHRPEASISSDDIQRLIGTMKRDTDVGLFVTSGDFSQPAKTEARLSGKHIELIDFDRFIELWIQYYDKMKDEIKYMLPLHPIYFLGSNE
ncbi:MAG TPA: restriction endonuclease [Chitinophagales bacterium]|nr:restriction endonuclease [Chitinophagales bacterium]